MLPKSKSKLATFSYGGPDWGEEGSGYKFAEDTVANQMAYVFGGPEGEKEAEEIQKEAEKKYPAPLQIPEKKQFIENKVKERAQKVDKGFHNGLVDIAKGLANAGIKNTVKGEDAGKSAVIGLTKGLGLNVDSDNVQTHYTPGPPQIFKVTWLNRPTENLKNENSAVNNLAKTYGNCLPKDEKKSFDDAWNNHKMNAKNGGPKMNKAEFEKKAEELFEQDISNRCSDKVTTAPVPPASEKSSSFKM